MEPSRGMIKYGGRPPQKRGVALFSAGLLFPPSTFVMGTNTVKYSNSIYEKQLLNDL